MDRMDRLPTHPVEQASSAGLLGVDTGGTFTDFVWWDGRALHIDKVLSTPEAPERAILQGIAKMKIPLQGLTVVHGSTVATNAVLEGKGVRTLLITNRGFGDLLTIGRQARTELYNLQPEPLSPPVPREDCLETGGRIGADGTTLEPLTEADLRQLRSEIEQRQAEAVAINLLFSFLDPEAERRIEAVVPKALFVSRSSRVLPEYREYERGITTWLNSYVGPLVEGYLQRLESRAGGAKISVMQSSGNTIAAHQAGAEAVHMLLSGPAGGLAAARFIGEQVGRSQLLTFDMGGTSTDVALLDGAVGLTTEGKIGRYPVAVPMVDMHTIGAGGGSIARVDSGGMLLVGPESAGAEPGPACYSEGGGAATVTDANLLLGRLLPDAFLGGEMVLDRDAARLAMSRVAEALDCSIEAAAEGVVRVANEHMSQALRVISIQRGVDPREFTLVSFGGAGGLHVCALAESMGIRRALIPLYGGVLSALGMLVAPHGRELSRSRIVQLDQVVDAEIEREFEQLAQQGVEALLDEGVEQGKIDRLYSVDLRYHGQSFTLNLPWQGRTVSQALFHQAHQERYGHCFDFPVELVNLRVTVREQIEVPFSLQGGDSRVSVDQIPATAVLSGIGVVPVYRREQLTTMQPLEGPLLITERVATSLVAAGWRCMVDPTGVLLLEQSENGG
jgi:N-methylhydantoinase A